ncbi:MAG: YgjV family protein [Microbacteriaceae bacterium]|nr:YgjV family protein [Microbacteriaceae bacterium]
MTFWVEVLGWVGSATLIVGILQKQMLQLRLVSLVAALLLVAYNVLIASWPMVAMNVVIFAINAVRFLQSMQERRTAQANPATVSGGLED